MADATTSHAAHAETLDCSNMDDAKILQLAFRDFSMGPAIARKPGRWETELAFLLSDKQEASTYLECTDLKDIDKGFSISTYLSPAGVNQVGPTMVLHNGEPIDGALLACLALNEECRKKGSGVLHHLPLRHHQQVGHVCDLVFKRLKWDQGDKDEWDNSSWTQRLDRYRIDETCYGALSIQHQAPPTNLPIEKIDSSDLVIPICSRILHFSEEPVIAYKQAVAVGPVHEIAQYPLPNYCSDPSVVENAYRYSRPVQDLSTYLVLYPSLHTPPLICATGVFEDKTHCDRQPTQNEMSETFTLRVKSDAAELHGKVARAMYELSRKRYLVAGKPMSSNEEVLECLSKAWKKEDERRHSVEMTDNGDKVRYFWQELKNMVDTGPEMKVLAATWPKK